MDIVARLRFDAARCEAQFSKGVSTNIEEAAAEIERLRAMLKPFADMADRVRSGESLPDAGVIVDCCYHAKAALER